MHKLKQVNYNLLNYIIRILHNKLNLKLVYKLNTNEVILYVNKKNLEFLLSFLKNHYALQFKTLISITAIDYTERADRFEVNYFILSYKLNIRLIIKTATNDIEPIPSIVNLYRGASWYEREV